MALLELLTTVGRFIEYRLTGQADFRVSVPFGDARTVETDLEGRLQLDRVRGDLFRDFGLTTRWPVLLEVKAPPPLGWKAGFYHSEGNLGRYETKTLGSSRGHHVTIRPGLQTPIFRAILGHELVHAVQTEHNILIGNQALREGMARWVEYHFLRDKQPAEAERLRKLRHYTFGKAIETILEYEESHGRQATLGWLKTYDLAS